jgi:hypothetical protein
LSKVIKELDIIISDIPQHAVYIGSANQEDIPNYSGTGHVIVTSRDPKLNLSMICHKNGSSYIGELSKLDIDYSYVIKNVKFKDIKKDIVEN